MNFMLLITPVENQYAIPIISAMFGLNEKSIEKKEPSPEEYLLPDIQAMVGTKCTVQR